MSKARMATLAAVAGGAVLAAVAAVQSPAAAAAVPSPVAGAAAASPVKLSIALTDNRITMGASSAATYTATVTNSGTQAVSGTLVFSAPGFVQYTHVPRHGRITKHDAWWKITVPGGESVTEQATVRVRTIPKSAVRVTSLASFYIGAVSGAPVIRAADADRIHGVKEPAPAPAIKPPAANPKIGSVGAGLGAVGWSLIGAGALALAALVAGLGVWRRRVSRPGRLRDQDSADGNPQSDDLLARLGAGRNGADPPADA